ncbi:MAG TPA: DinB family protein [Bryobacteraceae bacterium]|nr:DinB family protein [Bryobacteraceae bacterium]
MVSLTREQYLDSIRKLSEQALSFADRLSTNQLTWQPMDGARWSVLECLDHLAVFNTGYLAALESAASNAPSGGRAGEFRTAGFPSEKFLSIAEPPPSFKAKAPSKLGPRPTLYPEKILPEFLATLDRVNAFVRNTNGKDLNAVRFANPFIPMIRFTVGTGLLVLGAHARRHIYQAEEVLKEPDFPRE